MSEKRNTQAVPPTTKEKKRLHELKEYWTGNESFLDFRSKDFAVADLRLMLERFEPLRELIQQIAATGATPSGLEHLESVHADPQQQAKLTRLQQVFEEERGLKTAALAEKKRLEKELAECKKTLIGCEKELSRLRQQADPPPVLLMLRHDTALTSRLGLNDLPDDTTNALIHAVAVLAQLSSIERLWEALKERCDREKRPANIEETDLLATTLTWHNHNWATKPYTMQTPKAGERFDFATQQRPASTPSGETIMALWLPGIADGTGKQVKKPLVATH